MIFRIWILFMFWVTFSRSVPKLDCWSHFFRPRRGPRDSVNVVEVLYLPPYSGPLRLVADRFLKNDSSYTAIFIIPSISICTLLYHTEVTNLLFVESVLKHMLCFWKIHICLNPIHTLRNYLFVQKYF